MPLRVARRLRRGAEKGNGENTTFFITKSSSYLPNRVMHRQGGNLGT
jgi:hypothetical protein